MSRLVWLLAVAITPWFAGCGKNSAKLFEVAAGWIVSTKEEADKAKQEAAKPPGPENPVQYVQERLRTLDLREIEVKQARHRANADALKYAADAEMDKVLGRQRTDKLVELKAAYQNASAKDRWPVRVSGVNFDVEELQRIIVRTYGDVQRSAGRRDALTRAVLKRQTQMQQADQLLESITSKRLQLREKLQLLELQGQSGELDKLIDDVNRIYADGMAFDTKNALELSADDLLAIDGKGAQQQLEFQQIMLEGRAP